MRTNDAWHFGPEALQSSAKAPATTLPTFGADRQRGTTRTSCTTCPT